MKPFFLDSQSGPLFAVYWSPVDREPVGAFLHVPAFAEEMNKSRRMLALQAKALAEQGYAVLVLDLFGTGDSCGDFGEASWLHWLADITAGVAWLKRQGIDSINLWSLRAGALLAMDYVSRNSDEVMRLLAWQPVLNGDTFVTQFLRLRVAAAMMNNAVPQENTGDLKKLLQQGQELEVAGYSLNPGLVNPLMALKLEPSALASLRSVDVFEVVAARDAPPSFVNQQFSDNLSRAGIAASLTMVAGPQFWVSQEITTSPALLVAMLEKVKQRQ